LEWEGKEDAAVSSFPFQAGSAETVKKLGLILLLIGLPLLAYWSTPREPPLVPGVTLENFQRLHRGMSRQQAINILGSEYVLAGNELTWEGPGFRIILDADSFDRIHLGRYLHDDDYGEFLRPPPLPLFARICNRICRFLGLPCRIPPEPMGVPY
jgi:hypothetical protein